MMSSAVYKRNSTQRGFTLLELMITVAIIGIIAAIAYPSYQQFVQKSRRADGMAALMSLAGAMERFYTVNSTYVGAASAGDGSPPAPEVFPSQAPLDGGTKYYNLIVADENASSFAVNAVPIGAQQPDPCGTLTLDHTGDRGKTGSGTDCWP